MLNQLPSAVGATPDALVLRLRTNGAEELESRIVRVTASRCAIGNGEVCNLQVPGPGPERMNCLIVRGRRYPIVRRWSRDTLLNGQSFADAVLSPGDHLTTAGVELEVLAGDDGAEPTAAAIEVATEPGGDMRALALRHWEENDRLRAACEQNRARARRVLAIARELRDRLSSHDEAESQRQPSAASEPEVHFEATSAEAPVSASSLLMQLGAVLADEEDATPTPEPRASSHEPAELSPAAEEPSAAAHVQHAEASDSQNQDESIDSYMARLMDRVAQKKANRDVPTYSQDAGAASAAGSQPADEPPEPARPEPLTELPLRSVAPAERSANMSAMRELAKLNAHTLLDTHLRRTFFRSTGGQASVMMAAMLAGLWLTRLSSHGAPVAIYPAMIAFALAIVWGFNYLAGVRYVLGAGRTVEGAHLTGKPEVAIAAKPGGSQRQQNPSRPAPPGVAGAPSAESVLTPEGAPEADR